ncbi:FIG00849952: hypothetical protein [Neisseria meningitidis serogroup B]|uniref:Uncharacterized protein n=1 Tax=Neisseria meningitidis serogroup B TaxID=491 RepID=A0A0H5QAE2_NEIMI|nr:FIG00849952: hypothetical protein [Neisseria meningitidis serogroup B]
MDCWGGFSLLASTEKCRLKQHSVSDGISFSLTLLFACTDKGYRQGSKDHRNLGSRACTQRQHLIQ